ncbi:hypothetical protein [Streptomyces sp. NPDC058307]|uniref:hypothetical protein n=1 Tax=Streptomyces sp. NPDC058307 TaxID=3346439 RepID=UPI0036F09EDE
MLLAAGALLVAAGVTAGVLTAVDTGAARGAQVASAASAKAPYAPYVADPRAQNVVGTGGSSPALPITLAAALTTAVATTTVFALRRRGTRAATR